MELLAPAGSKEALVAAIEAGADAVYVGIKEFNARRKAKNFNLYDLQVMCDYVHDRGRKLYLALNILIKQREIESVFDVLNRLEASGPDAVIVQDLGLHSLLSRYFPGIPRHASTQMAVHNSRGAQFLRQEGFSRVILARELSLSEIEAIRRNSSIELEVFAHGALCFSLSGLCFASSFIGGSSGNRGLCTQPCRRIWKAGKKEGYLLSTRDLQALSMVSSLRDAGVSSLKIEGRMRSAEYVSRVVRAYRQAIDGGLRGEEDVEDFSRQKTRCYLQEKRGPLILHDHPGATGKRAGVVSDIRHGQLFIRADEEIKKGNRLRICDSGSDSTITFSLKELYVGGKAVEGVSAGTYCTMACPEPVKKKSVVYIVRSSEWDEGALRRKVDGIYKSSHAASRRSRYSQKKKTIIVRELAGKRKAKVRTELRPSVRIDASGWLDVIQMEEVLDIIVSLDALFEKDGSMSLIWSKVPARKIVVDLPPFIAERDLRDREEKLLLLQGKGFTRWMAENVSHLKMLEASAGEVMAGPFIYTMNSLVAEVLSRHAVHEAVASYEEEFLNLRDILGCSDVKRRITVFSYPPCFITRADAGLADGGLIEGSGVRLRAHLRGELTWLRSESPFSLLSQKEKLLALSPAGFLIDLYFAEPSRELWKRIMDCWKNGTPFAGSTRYNFKRGLK